MKLINPKSNYFHIFYFMWIPIFDLIPYPFKSPLLSKNWRICFVLGANSLSDRAGWVVSRVLAGPTLRRDRNRTRVTSASSGTRVRWAEQVKKSGAGPPSRYRYWTVHKSPTLGSAILENGPTRFGLCFTSIYTLHCLCTLLPLSFFLCQKKN